MAEQQRKPPVETAAEQGTAGDTEEQLDHTGGAVGISREVTERDREYVARHEDSGQAEQGYPSADDQPRAAGYTYDSRRPG